MKTEGTLLLRRSEVEQLLTLPECIDAVEEAFRMQGKGKLPPAGSLGGNAPGGGLHIKAALLPHDRTYLVAKLNTNFPRDRTAAALPTIQGLILLCDGENGAPLAVLDSIDITIKRTPAASAGAGKNLARPDSSTATICGCGEQAAGHRPAPCAGLPLREDYV